MCSGPRAHSGAESMCCTPATNARSTRPSRLLSNNGSGRSLSKAIHSSRPSVINSSHWRPAAQCRRFTSNASRCRSSRGLLRSAGASPTESLIAGAAATWPLAARAQQSTFQVGFLYPGPQAAASPRIAAYSSGLQAGGIRPEQVNIIARVTGGDAAPLAPMAADLVARKVDLIAAISPAAVRAAQAATATIPIVAGDLESDPVASGFAASIARPGGNITGVFLDFLDFSKKWLEALKEAVPQMAQVAVFWDPATGPMQRQAVEAAAQTLNLKLTILQVATRADFEPAFQSATQRGAEALVMLSSPLVGANSKLLAGLAWRTACPR